MPAPGSSSKFPVRPLDILWVPCALGAPDSGVATGPDALRQGGLAVRPGWPGRETTLPVPHGPRLAALADVCASLAGAVAARMAAGGLPLIVGGDHSIAAGTWRGVAEALLTPPGLLWIDAHLDAHTPADSPSGNPHGMPVAMLLGEGDPPLAQPVLAPQRLCLIGARSWEPSERTRLERLGARIFDHEEIRRRGLSGVMTAALSIAQGDGAGFGVSLDMDVFDPTEAPGVNTPVPGGLPAADWLAALAGLAARPDCRALELVEYDPTRDRNGITAQLAQRTLQALCADPAAP